jgi:hypothetical protein
MYKNWTKHYGKIPEQGTENFGRLKVIYSCPGRVQSVTSRLGTGIWRNHFLQCGPKILSENSQGINVQSLTLSIRHVTIVPLGNEAFYWLSGTKNLPAANRKAVYIHVTKPVICISERFFSHTAHSRHLKGGRGGEQEVRIQRVFILRGECGSSP